MLSFSSCSFSFSAFPSLPHHPAAAAIAIVTRFCLTQADLLSPRAELGTIHQKFLYQTRE
jgi:hypothetical protein